MDGEDKKVILKKRSKVVDINLDSDDDEPIGSLFKLKSKRNPKKFKLGTDGEKGNKVEVKVDKDVSLDEDLGEMEDTLASFKKKLKGPKKDRGSGSLLKKESLKDEGNIIKSVQDNEDEVGDMNSDVRIGQKLEKKRDGKPKRSKSKSAGKGLRVLVNIDDSVVAEGILSENVGERQENPLSPPNKHKNRVRRPKSTSTANNLRDEVPDDDPLKDQVEGKEGLSSSSDEIFTDSLASLLRKAQSSKLKRGGQGLENDHCPSSNAVSLDFQSSSGKNALLNSKLDGKSLRSEDLSSSSPLIGSNAPFGEKSNDTMVIDESMRPYDDQCGFTSEPILEHSFPVSQVQESNCSLVACSEKIRELKLSEVCGKDELLQEEPLMDSSTKLCNKDSQESHAVDVDMRCASDSQNDKTQNGDGQLVSLNASSRENDVLCPTYASEVMEELNKPNNSETNTRSYDGCTQHDVDMSRFDPLLDDHNLGKDAFMATNVNEGANENGAYQDAGFNNKCDSLVLNERATRKVKKRKDGDMAYEGDIDWEVVMHDQGPLDSHCVVDKDQGTRAKERVYSSSNADVDIDIGRAAAVSVGLKAHAVGPVEKIKFKEVFKRKGGLQEYLECRNKILSLWSKDVTRILPLKDCGVTTTPIDDELPNASLMRDIYSFLDQHGYINIGIAASKEKAEISCSQNYKLLGEKKFEGNSGASVADLADGVSFILGQVKSQDTLPKANNDVLDDENHSKEALKSGIERVVESSLDKPLDECPGLEELDNQFVDDKKSEKILELDHSTNDLLEKGSERSIHLEANDSIQCDSEDRKRIIVVGAGPAGLTAARHLQRQGYYVTVLEARSRIGGRVYTDRSSLSVPVDLGASIITGVEADVASERRPDPSSLICAQLGLELTILNSDCPLYDITTGEKVPTDVDEALEAEFNSLLDDMELVVAQKGESAVKMSLEDGLEYGLQRRRKYEILSPLERRVMDWHFAHLEYGCAALLREVSLPHWNQDDIYGGFGGAHCMIKGGYSAVVESISQELPIHLNQVVTDIDYSKMDSYKVKVSTFNGNEFFGDAVLITVPLGCLKRESIKFSPPLPQWKHSAIQRLGFGVLNKVILEFPEAFWDDTVDYFGTTAENTDLRGRCFMFWNVKKTVGAPVLIALVVGKAAVDGQDVGPSDHVNHALAVLRKLFGENVVPNPVASLVTDWGRDPFSYGAYSYVAIGSSGEDYDILGRPVENCLFFAGEATCKEHPDTVGGAMLSGLREAVRIIDILATGNDCIAEAEAIEAAQIQSDSERNEVKDIARRLDAIDLSKSQTFTRESLLQNMFFNAKTFAGRLRLAKELLSLPVESLKSFAGTKEGLSVLNSWILDSMGKDGTQLLRHCVRILVLVSTDLVAVRFSGIGKTVKEKVCVHTSRDIRSIASQLVNMWIEVFRKEKATNGGLKLLRHASNSDSLKAKGKELGSRKPPLRVQYSSAGNKANFSSKRLTGKPMKPEIATGSKTEAHSTVAQVSQVGPDNKVEGDSIPLSEEEKAALAAAEAAHAAALAAAEAYASSEAKCSMMQLPKIPSFQKFARREQYAQMDDYERRMWSGGVLGRQDTISEIDSRNCRVRDWSVDFSATCANLENSRLSTDNLSQRSPSNDMACHNWKEYSGESGAGDSTAFTKAWVNSSGSVGIKDYHAIERWQCQAAAAEYEFQSSINSRDEEDSSTMSRLLLRKEHEGLVNESSVSQVTVNKELIGNQRRGAEHIKQGVVDYVASLLMPLYKARKIDKDGYKSIMKKSATKVMEQTNDAEKAMAVFEFLDFKRKNKIRAFVDKLIERHMSMKPVMKP